MEYNFKKHESKRGMGNYKGGLNVGKKLIYILERDFISAERINVYLDLEKNAIKIIVGYSYKLFLRKRGKRGNYKAICAVSLVKAGLKTGHYKYVGDSIFVLENKE